MKTKCPNCSTALEHKEGVHKLCAQVGNPDIAIVETTSPHFCNNCKEYFLDTEGIVSAVIQIKNMSEDKKSIDKGIYT